MICKNSERGCAAVVALISRHRCALREFFTESKDLHYSSTSCVHVRVLEDTSGHSASIFRPIVQGLSSHSPTIVPTCFSGSVPLKNASQSPVQPNGSVSCGLSAMTLLQSSEHASIRSPCIKVRTGRNMKSCHPDRFRSSSAILSPSSTIAHGFSNVSADSGSSERQEITTLAADARMRISSAGRGRSSSNKTRGKSRRTATSACGTSSTRRSRHHCLMRCSGTQLLGLRAVRLS